jgi:hypothetical protein
VATLLLHSKVCHLKDKDANSCAVLVPKAGKETKEGDEGRGCERKDLPLNFNGVFTLISKVRRIGSLLSWQ